jgi:hypothetical protein
VRDLPACDLLGLDAHADLHRRVRHAALTVARRVSTSPTWTGERNFISSTVAVTTRPPACRVAAIAATSSQSFMIHPP